MAIVLNTQNITNMYTPIELVTVGGITYGSGGVTDHGLLHGLGDNDHPHYVLTVNAASHSHSDLLNASHNHGGAPAVTGVIGGTIGSAAWSLSIPDFLLTAAESDHSHSDYLNTSVSTAYQTSVLATKFLTTAANSTHIHGSGTQLQGTNITIGSSSNALALSVANAIPLANSTAYQTSVLATKFLTTAANSTHSHGAVSTVATAGTDLVFTSASSGLTIGVPAWLTTAAAGGNNITLAGNTAGTLTEISSGTATIVGGDNITLSQDGNAFTIIGAASGTDAGIAFSISSSNTSGTAGLVSSGTLYLEGGSNITVFQEANTIQIIGADPVTTYLGTDQASNFAGIGSTSSGITGSVLQATFDSVGLHLGIPAWVTNATVSASNSVYAGDYVSLSTDAVATTVSVTGLQATSATSAITANALNTSQSSHFLNTSQSGNFVATAFSTLLQHTSDNSLSANATHSHGSLYTSQITGSVITNSSVSSGLTLGIPAYITTAGAHTHGSNVYSSSTSGTDIKFTSASNSLLMGIPPYAVTSHTHSNLYAALSGTTAYQTSVLSQTFAQSSNVLSTSQSGSVYFSNGSGVSFGSTANSNSTTITGSVNSGNVYFVDSLGTNLTWGSSTSGYSTSIYASAGVGTDGFDAGISTYGNTAGTTGTISNQLILVGGSNITLSQSTDATGATVSIVGGAGAGGGVGAVSASNGSFSSSTLPFGSSILTFFTNSDGMQGSYTVPASGTLSFINSNGVSFGSSSDGSTTSVSASVETAYIPLANSTSFGQVWNISSNTLGTSSSAYGSLLRFAGSNSLSLSGGSDGITIIAPNNVHNFSASGNTLTSNSTSGSFGTNGFNVYGSGLASVAAYSNSLLINVPATHTHSAYVGLATTGITGGSATINSSQLQLNIPSGSVYYVDSNGVSFGASTSGLSTTITASVEGVSAGAGTGFSSASTEGTAMVGTLDSNGLSLGIPAWITTGAAGGGDWSIDSTSGTDIVISTGADTNTLYQPAFITTAAGGGGDWSISTTSGTDFVISTAADTITFYQPAILTTAAASDHTHSDLYVALGDSTFYQTSNLSSVFQTTGAYLTTAAESNHTHSDLYLPVGNSTDYASSVLANTFLTTWTVPPSGTLSFINSNGVSFGSSSDGSTTSVSASVETAYVPLANSTNYNTKVVLSNFVHPRENLTDIASPPNGELLVKHMYVPFNVTGTAMKVGAIMLADTGTSETTASVNISLRLGVYTLNGSTLSLASSGSANNGFQWSQGDSTTANTSVDGYRQLTVPVNVNMTPGEYWVVFNLNTATTYTSQYYSLLGIMDNGNDFAYNYIAPIGSTVSRMIIPYHGVYTATTSALPSSIGSAAVNFTSESNVIKANFWNAIYNNTY